MVSPCAQKVRWVLYEKKLDYVSHIVNIVEKENLAPAYLRLNPRGVVPTLVDSGIPIVESSLICEYLDEVYPRKPLLRGDVHQRLATRLWMKTVDEAVHPSLGALAWAISLRRQFLQAGEAEARAKVLRVPDPVRRSRQLRILEQGMDAPDVIQALAIYVDFCQHLEDALQQQDWLGEAEPDLADGAVMPYIHALYQYGVDDIFVEEGGALERWFKRMASRNSYAKAVLAYLPAERLDLLAGHGRASREALAERLQSLA